MSLKDTLEDLKKQAAEAQEREEKELEQPPQPEPAPEPEAPEEPPAAPEKPEEPPKPEGEEKPEEPPKKTPGEYAKERKDRLREAQRLQQENAELKAALEAERKAREATAQPKDPEPDPADEIAHTQWELRQTKQDVAEVKDWKQQEEAKKKADAENQVIERSIVNLENETRKTVPEYDHVKNHYARVLAAGFMAMNPNIAPEALQEAVKVTMINRVIKLAQEGHENPVAVMVEQVKNMGYQPPAPSPEPAKETPRVDLAKLAQNRARNAGTAGAQGKGGAGEITLEAATRMPNKEFAKLSVEDKRRLFGG